MNLIVCVSRNWGIGKNNELLFHIPDDLKQFKALTTGKVVVMGHNTLNPCPAESLCRTAPTSFCPATRI